MKQLSSAQFRRSYARETEPVEVMSYNDLIGTWIPASVDLDGEPEVPDAQVPGARFSIRPDIGPRRAMVASERRVIDPLEMRKQQQERDDEIQTRTFSPRRQRATADRKL